MVRTLRQAGGAEPLPAPPRLVRAEHLTFGAGGPAVPRDQAVRRAVSGYLADMLRPHGMAFDEARLLAGNQNSYAYLASQCLARMCGRDEPDLVVLAHAAADCEPNRSLGAYLSTLFRGEPLCFGVCDQGDLSPFTALSLLRGLGTSGGYQRALVLVLDQSTRPHPPLSGTPGTTGSVQPDHVVGLLFDTGPALAGRSLAGVWQRSGVTPGTLRQALAEVAAGMPATEPSAGTVTVVAGEHIDAPDLEPLLGDSGRWPLAGGRLCRTPPGPACVAPWAVLAGWPGGAAHSLLVVGYDRPQAALSVALFDPVTGGSAAGEGRTAC